MQADEIVGYSFRADIYCPNCIVDEVLAAIPVSIFTTTDPAMNMAAEEALNMIADDVQLDRGDETSFDSGEFPKVIFPHMVNALGSDEGYDDGEDHGDYCASCGAYLIEAE